MSSLLQHFWKRIWLHNEDVIVSLRPGLSFSWSIKTVEKTELFNLNMQILSDIYYQHGQLVHFHKRKCSLPLPMPASFPFRYAKTNNSILWNKGPTFASDKVYWSTKVESYAKNEAKLERCWIRLTLCSQLEWADIVWRRLLPSRWDNDTMLTSTEHMLPTNIVLTSTRRQDNSLPSQQLWEEGIKKAYIIIFDIYGRGCNLLYLRS